MAVFRWIGGSLDLHQGRSLTPADWYDVTAGAAGVAAPQAGDTETITAVASPGVIREGALYNFLVGITVTRVLTEPDVPGLTLLDNPNAAIGYTIQGQVLNLDGTQGILDMWLQNSRLLNDTFNVTGIVVIDSYLDSVVSGSITLGSATAPAHLQTVVFPTDTLGVGPSDHYTATTYDANVTVNAGSEFEVEAGTAGTVAAFVNKGVITASPGGTLEFDDTDTPNSASFTGQLDQVAEHSMLLVDQGVINVLGAAGRTTRAILLTETTGPGSIVVNGNGAAPGATTLTVDGYLKGVNVTLTDGTVTVNDTIYAETTPGLDGFDVTGGSFTFGDANGVLVLNQAELTKFAFNAAGTRQVWTPDGRTPFTTPIHGFGRSDLIKLPGKGHTTTSPVIVYSAATRLLQIQAPSYNAGDPPEILASLTFAGSYDPAGFHLSSGAPGELDLTYNAPAPVDPVFSVTDTTAHTSSVSAGAAYTGPVSYLQHQYIWAGAGGATIAAQEANVFLRGGAGDDALQALGGSNVLDGGPGSNFLIGASGTDGGTDTFLLNGRAAGSIWSTVVNFHHGDAVTIFGFTAGVSTTPWTAVDGAAGHTGATIHSELRGAGTGVNASVTFAGVSLADTQAKFSVTSGVTGATPYLNIAYTG